MHICFNALLSFKKTIKNTKLKSMKNISLIVVIFLMAIIFNSCGAKEETTEETNPDTEITDETTDDSDYLGDDEFVSEETATDSEINDSTLTGNLEFTDDTQPILVDEQKEDLAPAVVEKKEEPVKETVKVHETRFYVVVGSFKKFSNAKNLSNYFTSKGYNPMILPKVNGYNRVAISSYVEKANAKKAVVKLRKEYNDLTFWIYQW